MPDVLVTGAFDDLRLRDVRFLHEASRLGLVHVRLASDDAAQSETGASPRFPQEERRYLLESIRYVDRVSIVERASEAVASVLEPGTIWVVPEWEDAAERRTLCERKRLTYQVVSQSGLDAIPSVEPTALPTPSVLVSGCYDWLHSGHVRFFEEASSFGSLCVTVGNDESVSDFKGPGHPMQSQRERRYMVGSVRFVTECLVSTGSGWLDAVPEIERLRPDMLVVNDDGDRPEKRAYCEANGIEYRVLKRLPRAGLPRRASTDLRGF